MKKCRYAIEVPLIQNSIGHGTSTVTVCAKKGAENEAVEISMLKKIACIGKCKDREEIEC